MKFDKGQALVVRSIDFSDTSKVVTLATREFGKISAIAKGARRPKSSFEGALDVLSVCSICVLRKPTAELDILTEAKLLERFSGLGRDLGSFYAGFFVAELLDNFLQRDDPHPALYDQALETLRLLEADFDRLLAVCRFLMALLDELGFGLVLDRCTVCGQPIILGEAGRTSITSAGLVGPECDRGSELSHPIRGETIQILRQLRTGGLDLLGRLKISGDARAELWRALLNAVSSHLGKRPKLAALMRW